MSLRSVPPVTPAEMGQEFSPSRATAIRNHIWDGHHFRALKPTPRFPPLPPYCTHNPTVTPLPEPKLVARREVQWILTPSGLGIEEVLARGSSLLQCEANWDTLCSSDELLDVGVHWQEVESHGDQGRENSSGSGGCPGGMQLKARSVTGVTSEPEISSVVTVVSLNAPPPSLLLHVVGGFYQQPLTAEGLLRRTLFGSG